jgi:iron uptake system component EfeO
LNPLPSSHVHGFARLALPCIVVAVLATTAAPKIHAASFDEATERYRGLMIADMDRALAGAQTLRDRIKANDIPGAKKAWIGWERSEVFTSGFIPELDDAIDA